jgi:hypothetical protein
MNGSGSAAGTPTPRTPRRSAAPSSPAEVLARHPRLEFLSLAFPSPRQRTTSIVSLTGVTTLRELDLTGWSELAPDLASFLPRGLRALSLRQWSRLNDDALDSLASLDGVDRLVLAQCQGLTDSVANEARETRRAEGVRPLGRPRDRRRRRRHARGPRATRSARASRNPDHRLGRREPRPARASGDARPREHRDHGRHSRRPLPAPRAPLPRPLGECSGITPRGLLGIAGHPKLREVRAASPRSPRPPARSRRSVSLAAASRAPWSSRSETSSRSDGQCRARHEVAVLSRVELPEEPPDEPCVRRPDESPSIMDVGGPSLTEASRASRRSSRRLSWRA